MSEPKLCPYRRHAKWVEPTIRTEFDYLFADCLQDKCAMWRDHRTIYLPTGETVRDNSYCGLAGKP